MPSTTKRVAVSFTRTGEGPPLLLVHGLGSHQQVWQPLLPELESRFDVINVDLPGHGHAPRLAPGSPATPEALAAELAKLLDDLGVVRPHVVGSSLGGWIALELAKAGRAESVTAFAPAGFWDDSLSPRHRSHKSPAGSRRQTHRANAAEVANDARPSAFGPRRRLPLSLTSSSRRGQRQRMLPRAAGLLRCSAPIARTAISTTFQRPSPSLSCGATVTASCLKRTVNDQRGYPTRPMDSSQQMRSRTDVGPTPSQPQAH